MRAGPARFANNKTRGEFTGFAFKTSVIARVVGEAPGKPVSLSLPSKIEGDGAPSGATIVSLSCPWSLAKPRGASRRAIADVFLTAPGRAFVSRPVRPAPASPPGLPDFRPASPVALEGRPDGRRQPSSWRAAHIGHRAEPRAARVRAFASSTPAGAASGSTIKTPHDSAPR
jgi:hypothetical protein